VNQTQAYAVALAVATRIYGDLLTQGWTVETCPDTGEVAVFVPGQCGDDGHAAHGLLTPTQASDTGDNDHGPGPCAELPWSVRVWYADGEGNQLWVSETTYYVLPY
jgi:hypothetical protein